MVHRSRTSRSSGNRSDDGFVRRAEFNSSRNAISCQTERRGPPAQRTVSGGSTVTGYPFYGHPDRMYSPNVSRVTNKSYIMSGPTTRAQNRATMPVLFGQPHTQPCLSFLALGVRGELATMPVLCDLLPGGFSARKSLYGQHLRLVFTGSSRAETLNHACPFWPCCLAVCRPKRCRYLVGGCFGLSMRFTVHSAAARHR